MFECKCSECHNFLCPKFQEDFKKAIDELSKGDGGGGGGSSPAVCH